MKRIPWMAMLAGISISSAALADITVPMNLVNEKGVQKQVGTVVISESKYGLVFTPDMIGLPPGLHGFHVHEHANCQPDKQDGKTVAAFGAGGHYDPQKTDKHHLPWGDGHAGDLPALYVAADGRAAQAVLAPRLNLSDMKGRSIVVHAGGDNHADKPQPLGGGGARIACGVVP